MQRGHRPPPDLRPTLYLDTSQGGSAAVFQISLSIWRGGEIFTVELRGFYHSLLLPAVLLLLLLMFRHERNAAGAELRRQAIAKRSATSLRPPIRAPSHRHSVAAQERCMQRRLEISRNMRTNRGTGTRGGYTTVEEKYPEPQRSQPPPFPPSPTVYRVYRLPLSYVS